MFAVTVLSVMGMLALLVVSVREAQPVAGRL